MQIEYCDECSKRLSPRDFEVGEAHYIGERVLCRACQDALGVKPAPRLVPVSTGGKGGSNSRMNKIGSGIRKIPGSGIRAPLPSSGAHKAPTPDSGSRNPSPGRRRITPPTGIRTKSPRGSGLRRPQRSSGYRQPQQVRSGIRDPQATSGAPRTVQSGLRAPYRRNGSSGSQLWISLLGIGVGLLVGAAIFFVMRVL